MSDYLIDIAAFVISIILDMWIILTVGKSIHVPFFVGVLIGAGTFAVSKTLVLAAVMLLGIDVDHHD